MEFNRCSRCGCFYVTGGEVCPRCSHKDNLEFSKFIQYIQENGFEESLENISGEIGISVNNLNRFINYQGFEEFKNTIDLQGKDVL